MPNLPKNHLDESEVVSLYRDHSDSFRCLTGPNQVVKPSSLSKVLLVDDDPLFCTVMRRAADQLVLPLVTCCSLQDLSKLSEWDFDVAILDFNLGNMTAFQLIGYIQGFFRTEIPVILTSSSPRSDPEKWPPSIREFVPKHLGPFATLDAAFEAHEINTIQNKIINRIFR